MTKNTHPAYATMLEIARSVVRPTYHTDVTRHDRAALHARDNTRERPFIWAASDGGTFLCFVDVKTIDGVGHTPAQFPSFVERAFGSCRWFVWDGAALRASDMRDATDFARTFEHVAA